MIGVVSVVLGGVATGHPLRRAGSSDEGETRVVGGRGGEEQRVEPVEHAPVGAEQPAAVLHAGAALDERLEEIPERRRNGDREAEGERFHRPQPVLREGGDPDNRRHSHVDFGNQALDRLGWRDVRLDLSASPRAVCQVFCGDDDERYDLDDEKKH